MVEQRKTIAALPAFNEEYAIEPLLQAYRDLIQSRPELHLEVLVVNDGSTDNTLSLLKEWKQKIPLSIVSHETNLGLGAAFRTCLKESLRKSASDDDIIVCMDADNTHLPVYIPRLVEKINEGFDIVIASRFQPGSREIGVPFMRRVYSRIARILFSLFLRLPDVRDYTCGYRAYRSGTVRRALEDLGDDIIARNGFACTDDLLVNLSSYSRKISEIPFVLRYDHKIGKSKLPLLLTIRETLNLLFRRNRPRR